MLERKVDVLIIGGGVGGLTLAQWLTGLGRSWRIVERAAVLGGALAASEYILKWIPGQAQISGRDYLAAMVAQIDAAQCALATQLSAVQVVKDEVQNNCPETQILKHGVKEDTELHGDNTEFSPCNSVFSVFSVPSVVQGLGVISGRYFEPSPQYFLCTLSNGEQLRAKKLVFACGATPFSPFPESKRVIVGAGLQKIAHIAAGQRVAVLGGGDNAADHALILAEMGCTVTMLVRGQLCASAALLQQLRQNAAIVIKTDCQELALAPTANGVLVQGEPYDYAAVYFGYQASTQLNAFPALKTAAGELADGVFAIGDMTQPAFPNILLTQGQAAVVAKQIDFELSRDVDGV